MKRLYFLIPDLKVAHEVVVDLELIGISERRIHVIGGSPEALEKEHVPSASIFHTNIQPALKWGLIAGVCFSILIYALFTLALPVKIPPIAIFAMVVFGMGFGVWSTGLISLVKNPVIEKYEKYLKEGHYIMMVDAPEDKVDELSQHVTHYKDTYVVEKNVH